MDKMKCFEKEMSYIQNPNYLIDFQYLVSNLPDYFFEIPASSTGKYHPRYALGTAGLLRHTKAAVRIAYELLADPVIGDKYTSDEKDLMLIALCLHDGLKSGKDHSKYTQFDHPLLMANWIGEEKEHLHFNDDEISLLQSVISSHMGCWTRDYDGNEVLPKPKTKYQNFVHMCDYLASRKCILLEFDENNNVIG